MTKPVFVDKVTIVPADFANSTANLVYDVFQQATSVIQARSALGLGSMAVQNNNSVYITGGVIDGTIIGPLNPLQARFTSATVTQLTPVLPEQLTSKQYVDNLVGNLVNNVLNGNISNTLLAAKVNKAGDTMTGPLILFEDPVQAMEAATKQYVDSNGSANTLAAQLATQNNPSEGASLVGYRNKTVWSALDTLFFNATPINEVFASPASGAAGPGAFRQLVVADLPFAGQAGGVATLDVTGRVPPSQLPAALAGGLSYRGTWNAATNTPTLQSGVGSKGDFWAVSVAGTTTLDGTSSWNVGDLLVYNGTAWQKLPSASGQVTSVAGRVGDVVLSYTDIAGLSTVAHSGSFTDLLNIPIASATQLGLVKIGNDLQIDSNGVLSVNTSGGDLGTVRSVALSLPGNMFFISGSPVTSTGTLTGTLKSQSPNFVFAGPASGGSANIPTFRALVPLDLPIATSSLIGGVKIGNGLAVDLAGTVVNAGVTSFNGRGGDVSLTLADITSAGGAPLLSPAFTGTPTAPTPVASDNSSTIATTAFVRSALTTYSVPPATTTTLGVVKIGNGLQITGAGLLSSMIATTSQLGSVIVGSGLAVDASGTVVNDGVTTFMNRKGAVTLTGNDIVLAGGALIASPSFTGVPTAPTATAGTNTGQIATTAFVMSQIAAGAVTSFNGRGGAVTLSLADITGAGGAPLNSPHFTGVPTAPTVAISDNSTTLATTAFVQNLVAASGVTSFNTRTGAVTLTAADVTGVGGALLASPAFTGTPTAPTPLSSDNSTRIATTAYVQSVVAGNFVTSFNTRTGAVSLLASDVTGVGGALLASPAFTGTPTTPDIQLSGTTTNYSGTIIANGDWVWQMTKGSVSANVLAGTTYGVPVQQYLGALMYLGDGRGTPGPVTYTIPEGIWIVKSTTPAATFTLSNSAGAGTFVVPSYGSVTVISDGNGVYAANDVGVTQTAGDSSKHLATTEYVMNTINQFGVSSFNTRTGAVTLTAADLTGVGGALLASPSFTGVPTAPTAAVGNNSTQLATTAYIQATLLNGATVNVTGGAVTLTNAQYGSQIVIIKGTLTSDCTLTLPTSGQWTIYNQTTGNFAVKFTNGAGAVYTVPQNESASILANSSWGVINGNIAGNIITPATTTTIGGVIVPTSGGLTVDTNGNLSIGVASSGQIGGVKQGSGVTIAGDGTLSANVLTVAGRTGNVVLAVGDVSGAAPIASPAFTGTPTAATASVGTNTTQLATTAFVYAASQGSASVSLASVSAVTLTAAQYSVPVIVLTGTLTANVTVTLPNTGAWLIYNTCTMGSFTITLSNGTGSTPTLTSGNVYDVLSNSTAGVLIVTSTSEVASFNGRTGAVTLTSGDITGAGGALLASPTFTGTPAAPTASTGTSTTQIATTAFVANTVATYAPLASPALTGTPTAPTAAVGTNTTQLATTAFVYSATQGSSSVTLAGSNVTLTAAQYSVPVIILSGTLTANVTVTLPTVGAWIVDVTATLGSFTLTLSNGSGSTVSLAGSNLYQVVSNSAGVVTVSSTASVSSFNGRTGAVSLTAADVTGVGGALLASPTFTGTPAAPTASLGTNNTQIATTAYVFNATQGTVVVSVNGLASANSFSLNASQYSYPGIEFTGTLGGNPTVTFPTSGQWIVWGNYSDGGLGYRVTVTNGSGSSYTIQPSQVYVFYSAGTSGLILLTSNTNVTSFNTRTGAVTLQASDVTGVGGALLASPAFTGTPTAPTASAGTNTTQIATTAFVATSFAPLASPALTGTPTAPTATAGTNNTQLATTAYVYTSTQGSASVSLAGANVTLTAAQYSVPIIVLSGTLTANVTVTFPTTGAWLVYNTCTMGSFTITLSNGTGTTISAVASTTYELMSNSTAGMIQIASTASPTFTGRANIPAESFNVNQLGNVSGTITLDQSLYGEFTFTVTGNTTISLTNAPTGGQVTIIRMTNGGSATITWPANTKFANATVPTYTTSGTDVFVVLYDVVTSTYMVFVCGQAMG